MPRLQFAHGEELKDAILELFEAVVVLGEDLRCMREIGVVGRARGPRQGPDPVEVVADHAVLRGLVGRGLEPHQLLFGSLLRGFGQLGLRNRLFDALQLSAARVLLFAEFAADQLELFAEEVVLLGLLGLAANFALELAVDLREFHFGHDEFEHELQSLLDVRRGEHALTVLGVAHDTACEVGKLRRLLDVEQRGRESRIHLVLHLRELAKVLLQQAREGLGLLALRRDLDDLLHSDDEMRLLAHRLDATRATQPLRHRRHVAVGQPQRLEHASDHALLVEAVDRGALLFGIALQHDEQVPVVRLGLRHDLARLRRVEQ